MDPQKPPTQKPEPPRAAYIFFCDEFRDRARGQGPDDSPEFAARVLEQLWGKLAPLDKKAWEVRADEDVKRYKQEFEAWSKAFPEEAKKEKALEMARKSKATKKKSKSKVAQSRPPVAADSDTPKAPQKPRKKRKGKGGLTRPIKALTAFQAYLHATRDGVKEEHPEMSYAQILKEVRQRWGGVKDRTEYNLMAKADKERFEHEMRIWVEAGNEP